MDTILEMRPRGVERPLGRMGEPLHSRLLIMPIVVTTLAAGQPELVRMTLSAIPANLNGTRL
jgi:hypothetical protein